ncbi:MAG: HD domain-containing phosphohydrolase [Stenotrophobium sp.]
MNEMNLPAILCVDDEPNVLTSLSLNLRRSYTVHTAISGAHGLKILREYPDIVAVMSDMRMPVMNGAQFLQEARKLVPDAPRILLTGYADLDTAMMAVNDGQIFRFLVKPSAPPTVLAAFDAAREQHRLVTSEKILLSQTLKGAVKALSDVLSLASPQMFGDATRIKLLAVQIADGLIPAHRWAVEVAAMLARLGSIALPDDLAAKIQEGRPLVASEQAMVGRIPALTDKLLSSIPRLELVRGMLLLRDKATVPAGFNLSEADSAVVRLGASILRVAMDFDELESGNTAAVAIAILRARTGRYDAEVLAALEQLRGDGSPQRKICEIPLSELRAGMVIAADVRLPGGVLLVARGFEVSPGLVERLLNMNINPLTTKVCVYDEQIGGAR